MRSGRCSPGRRSTRRWRAPRPRSGRSSPRSSGSPSCGSRRRSCGATSAAGSRSTCSTTCAARSSPPSSGSTASGRTRCAPGRWSPARSPTSTPAGPAVDRAARAGLRACSSSRRSPPCCGCRRCSRWSRSSCCRSRWWITLRSRRALFPATWSAQQQAADIAQHVEETVTGVRVVKGFGQEAREVATLEAGARRLFGERLRAARMTARLNPALLGPAHARAGRGASASAAGSRSTGSITLGTFLAFTTYVAGLVGPARMLGALVVAAQLARAGVERVYDLVDSQPDVVDPEHPRHAARGPARRGARRRHVRLHAPRAGARRASASPSRRGRRSRWSGRRVRASPRSGCCCRASTTRRTGELRLGGVPLPSLRLVDLRSELGVVFEEAFLFSDTIRANIAYGRPDASDGRGAGRGEGGAGARVRREPARRLRHARRRARAHALRRAAAAGRAGQGGAHRPAGAGARRRHVRGRHRHRGRHPRHAARAHDGPHHAARRAPALHAGAGRPDRRARRGPGGRRRHGGRAAGPVRAVPRAVRDRRGRGSGRPVPAGGVTPELWPAATGPARRAHAIGSEAAGGMGGAGPMWTALAATPELLAAVEALPPPPDAPRLRRRPDRARSRLPAGPAAAPGARAASPWPWCSSRSMR